MSASKSDQAKNRRDVGRVVILSEEMAAAREVHSCCVGVEASLERKVDFGEVLRRLTGKR
ncbi:MAG: hypothetical protein RIC87_10885 [Kiloniellales bacterium]